MPSTIRPGDVLAGRYLLIDLLSESGDGRFWRAHDRVLARHVAVHVIPTGTARSAELLEAARGCARLTDRRFLRVLDAEVKGDACYVVTEWGTGTSLQLMLEHAPLAPRRAAWMVGEVGGAMSAAHAVGITHGRLVPENVLVDLSGTVRIVGAQVDATLKGLPRASESDDVRELVGLLYAGLTGRWPGRSPSAMPAAPLEGGRVLRPRQVRAGIPRALDELCDDILNSTTPPRAPFDLTTARGVADYLREYVGDPASMAAAEAERGSTATGQFPPVPRELLTPSPPVLPHDARPSRPTPATDEAHTKGDSVKDPLNDPLDDPLPDPEDAERTRERIRVQERPGAAGAAGAAAAGAAGAAAGAAAAESAASGSDEGAGAAASGEAGRTKVRARAADTADVPGDVPTQAGVPIFEDGSEDVGWLARQSEKPPPPPDFEEPPERPLFAQETPEQAEARRRAQELVGPAPSEEFWPWATNHTNSAVIPHPVRDPGARRRDAPGRTWLQLAGFLGALVALLLVVVVAYQVFAPDGGSDSEGSTGSSSAPGGPSSTATTGQEVTGLTGTALDPEPAGNGEENDDQVPNAFDGDPSTAWSTLTYRQQFGPSGLKEGVGVVVDLGEARALSSANVVFDGGPTSASFFVSAEPPTDVADLEPTATVEDAQQDAQVDLGGAQGRYLTVWLTSLPSVSDGFRGGVAEVRVFE
ncbi:protein kinase family protein [Nocardioides zeae]|uniref:Protein kinase family protein n=1 Tax=Nocardioides imazamoxiresistens TaxID=3231893 RepID=A0ABU3PUP3_9ACTN|nr:protein kinase family protein [Nocardioides zeae]MDT9592959.1 protein kinase family protein [Nocardioides zeae]